METITADRVPLPLNATLRAIEAGCRPSAEWNIVTQSEHREYVGYRDELRAAHADIEWGGSLLAGVVEPLRSLPGYLWIVTGSDESAALAHGIAQTLAEAKAAVEVTAADLAMARIMGGEPA